MELIAGKCYIETLKNIWILFKITEIKPSVYEDRVNYMCDSIKIEKRGSENIITRYTDIYTLISKSWVNQNYREIPNELYDMLTKKIDDSFDEYISLIETYKDKNITDNTEQK